jgi:hypothetical protein
MQNMERNVEIMTDEQLRELLMENYLRQKQIYPDSERVNTLKGELYRRGYHRTDVVTIAVASLLRQQRLAS